MVGHHGVLALERELDRRLPDRVGLLDVHLGGDVARGALQVVGNGPVELVAECFLGQLRNLGSDAAQLRVTEGILGAGLGEKFAVRITYAFRDHDDAEAVPLDAGLDLVEKRRTVEGDLGEQDDVRRIARPLCRPDRRRRRSSRRDGP